MACKKGTCRAKKTPAIPASVQSQSDPNQTALRQFNPIAQPISSGEPQGGWDKFKQGLKSFFWQTPAGVDYMRNFAPEQEDALYRLLQQGLGAQDNPYQGWDAMESDAQRLFFGDLIPRLQTQFSASGNNAISSPIFQNLTGQAAGDLTSRLAALKSQYGQQNQQLGLSKVGMGLSPLFSNANYRPAQWGLLPQLGMHAAQGLGLAGGLGIKTALGKLF
jgi:hypothetical protein